MFLDSNVMKVTNPGSNLSFGGFRDSVGLVVPLKLDFGMINMFLHSNVVKIMNLGSNFSFGYFGDSVGLGVPLKINFCHDTHVSRLKCRENHESGLEFKFFWDFGDSVGLGVPLKFDFWHDTHVSTL
jgi:hypothetical protein